MITTLAHANDPKVRKESTSGGFTKTFLWYLVHRRVVDKVILVRSGDGSTFHPSYLCTSDKSEILTPLTNSVYYPVDPRELITSLSPHQKYAIVTTPCWAKWLRNHQQKGEFTHLTLVIVLMCLRTPTDTWTDLVLHQVGVDKKKVKKLIYRIGSWPGHMYIEVEKRAPIHTEFYPLFDSISDQFILPKCLECTLNPMDLGDLVVGDPWEASKSLPVGDGETMVRTCTSLAENLIYDAQKGGYINFSIISDEFFDRQWKQLLSKKGEYGKFGTP